jgi:hypothetical protein
MAARKTRVGKKSTKAKARRIPRGSEALRRIEPELPANLREYSRQVRRGLVKLERQIETAQRDARRRWARLLREVSHQLGRLEAEGEKRWKRQTYPARREAVRLLKRLQRAIEPPRPRPARKRKVAPRSTGN